MVLITFPYVAVPAYWILGRSRFQGYVKARHAGDKKTQRFADNLKKAVAPFRVSADALQPAALETATLMFLDAINSANERIWIASPYFVPDDAIVNALQLAGLRGIDVRILIPDKPDHLLVFLAAYSYFEEAGCTGVRFFRYTDGFLHEKVMLIDDQVATVGTANFDNRSFRLNFEITAAVADEAFASQVEKMFADDFRTAREMAPDELKNKNIGFKLAVRLARLTAPIQ